MIAFSPQLFTQLLPMMLGYAWLGMRGLSML